MGAIVRAQADFGAFPGTDVASVAVVAAGCLSTSDVEAFVRPDGTVDPTNHSEDELTMLAKFLTCAVPVSGIVAGGYTVYVTAHEGFVWGKIPLTTVWG